MGLMKKWDWSCSVGQSDVAGIDLSKGLPWHKGDSHETQGNKKNEKSRRRQRHCLRESEQHPGSLQVTGSHHEGHLDEASGPARSPEEAAIPNLPPGGHARQKGGPHRVQSPPQTTGRGALYLPTSSRWPSPGLHRPRRKVWPDRVSCPASSSRESASP